MKSAQRKQIIDLNYVDHFDYKVKVITKTDVLKGYIDITIVLMFKIVIYQKRRRKGVKKFLLEIQKIESRVVWIRGRFLSNLGRLM
jgi:hypothetical protein